MPDTPPSERGSFFERWSKVIKTMTCVTGHRWDFRFEAKPPVVVCARCGRTDPMPYGDARMPYLCPTRRR